MAGVTSAGLPQGFQLGQSLPPAYLQALREQLARHIYTQGGDDPARFWEQRGNMVEMGDPTMPYTVRAQYGANPMQGGQLTGLQLYDNTGISGGGQVLNGRPSYEYDPSGNLVNTGTLSGFDDRIKLKDAAPAALVAFGGPLMGMGLNAMGLGGAGSSMLPAMETVSEGFGPAFEASVANGAAGSSVLPGLETVSEGFGPGFEQSVANGTWQIPSYAPGYGTLPGAPTSLLQNIGKAATSLLPGNGSSGSGFDWTKLIGPAASLVGGLNASNAAKDAANAQLTAAREAQAKLEPWYQAGGNALTRLQELMGIGGNKGAADYGRDARDFGMADFQADPGYAFRQSEGEKALQRAASAQGGIGSGKFLKDAMAWNQGQASNEFTNAFNRFQTNRSSRLNPLQSLAGQGQTTATTIGDLSTQAGNANAAGRVGSANAFTNALTQGYSMYNAGQQADQNKLFTNVLMERLSRGN